MKPILLTLGLTLTLLLVAGLLMTTRREPEVQLTVRVTNTVNGFPIAGALIQVADRSTDPNRVLSSVTTDKRGEGTLPAFRVYASRSGMLPNLWKTRVAPIYRVSTNKEGYVGGSDDLSARLAVMHESGVISAAILVQLDPVD